MSKKANDILRTTYVENLIKMLTEAGEETIRSGAGEIAVPVVDSEGNDNYVVFTVKVPTGSRDGEAYDPYTLAEDYVNKCEAKAQKAQEAKAKKEAKIARDAKARAERAEAKAKAQAK